ncbi:hypothetical protein ACSFA3_04505 [Variovorax sp. RHLX14]|uniref:hypothetical protein n=1 Tax=Variovorax sp. RHLX14 TaxID=1259731 RepID=UPI003F48510A
MSTRLIADPFVTSRRNVDMNNPVRKARRVQRPGASGKQNDQARKQFEALAGFFLPRGRRTTRRETDAGFDAFGEAVKALVKKELAAIEHEVLPWPKELLSAPSALVQSFHKPGVDAAIAAGAELRARIYGGPDMLTSDEFGKRAGVSRETVNNRRIAGQLLALSKGGRSNRYPAWQLAKEVEAVMPRLLEILSAYGPLDIYLFVTSGKALLDGRTPLDCLIDGESDRVLEAAAIYVDDMAPSS